MAEHFDRGGEGGPFRRMLRQRMLFLEAERPSCTHIDVVW